MSEERCASCNETLDQCVCPDSDDRAIQSLAAELEAERTRRREATDLLRGIVEDDCGKLRAKVWLASHEPSEGERCPTCNGRGVIDNPESERKPDPDCPRCSGTGEVTDVDSYDPSGVYWCPRCCPQFKPCPDPFHAAPPDQEGKR